jgi:hypothetical protein
VREAIDKFEKLFVHEGRTYVLRIHNISRRDKGGSKEIKIHYGVTYIKIHFWGKNHSWFVKLLHGFYSIFWWNLCTTNNLHEEKRIPMECNNATMRV